MLVEEEISGTVRTFKIRHKIFKYIIPFIPSVGGQEFTPYIHAKVISWMNELEIP